MNNIILSYLALSGAFSLLAFSVGLLIAHRRNTRKILHQNKPQSKYVQPSIRTKHCTSTSGRITFIHLFKLSKMELVKSNQLTVTQSFSPDQIALIKSQIAPKATENELKLFLYQCERTGLNPFARQIYCIHRKSQGEEKCPSRYQLMDFV
jgi:hypothetical protein